MSAGADRPKAQCVCLVRVRYLVATSRRGGGYTIGVKTDRCRRHAFDQDMCWQHHAKSAGGDAQG
jgi:hypothetical protein